jgi:hypothetical protein
MKKCVSSVSHSMSEDDALAALAAMVIQHCEETDDEYFSSFLTSDAMAMRVLAAHGIMTIEDGGCRVVCGRFLPHLDTDPEL